MQEFTAYCAVQKLPSSSYLKILDNFLDMKKLSYSIITKLYC